MKKSFGRVICTFLLATLACRPVIAIGWTEFLIFALLVAILFGPPLFRFIRKLGVRRREKKD